MRKCKKCGENKPLTQFRKSRPALNPEWRSWQCLDCKRAYNQLYKQTNPEKAKDTRLRCAYGISYAEYQKMLKEQAGVCAICKTPPTGKRRHEVLHVDHDHTTGEVRGLLCKTCNAALGAFQDSTTVIERAINYLTPSSYVCSR